MSQLNLSQRKQLEYLLQHGGAKKRIAQILGIHLSTLYREIKRNSVDGKYVAEKANTLAVARKKVVGSLPKIKRAKTIKRTNRYELYADRRHIYWHSDTPWTRKTYFFIRWHFGGKYHRYKIRLGWEKIYHYKNDIPVLKELMVLMLKTRKPNKYVSFKVERRGEKSKNDMMGKYLRVMFYKYARGA
ncbi:helix-turn-helix domain-containing protein [Flammeovirga sp. MY04]|uniref:helix-turn-helix domain-containing protein n=1 Tax=Flammeovirga sp. MY04 TaxID=1191459 RepID=UPI0008060841|nr:helix-turn-helix domain-containing protein [Flammeovirga sp. MY04]ANQ47885.1 helix-turn-helix domain-containing protein [Flammeovirga sp. MY04]